METLMQGYGYDEYLKLNEKSTDDIHANIITLNQNDELSNPLRDFYHPPENKDYGLESIKLRKKTKEELDQVKSRSAKDFYIKQNETIDSFEFLERSHSSTTAIDDSHLSQDEGPVKWVVNGSFYANIIICVLKIVAAFSSGSISVIASSLDSFLDLLAGSIFLITSKLQKSRNPYQYPIGKERLEPLGIVVFSCIMFTTGMQLVIEAIKRIIFNQTEIDFNLITISILSFTIISKTILFIYCRIHSSKSLICNTICKDHLNDVISNIGTIVFTAAGYYWFSFLDPIWAIAIGCFIMFIWVKTGFETIRMLTGYRADTHLMKKWTFLSLQHDPRIQAIDTVRAYHHSQGFVVEVDLVLPADMILSDAHDIGESLQFKLETLPEVERAFVHLDYSSNHKPEH